MVKILSFKRRAQEPAAEDARPTADGTMGNQLLARASTWLLVGCMITGPVLGGMALLNSSQPTAITAPTNERDTDAQMTASEIALHAVTVWLQAKRGDEQLVATYLPLGNRPLSEIGATVTSPSIASAVPSGGGLWSVTVAATVTTEDRTQRRYFRVPVQLAGTAGVVVAAPAEVSGPGLIRSSSSTVYAQDVPSSSPVRETVTQFLAALLVGQGDIARFTTPGSAITAVSPAPYSQVTVNEAKSKDTIPSPAAEGARIEVLVTATAATGRQASVVTYPLTLTSRGGRWEVSTIRLVPLTERASDSPRPAVVSSRPVVSASPASPTPTPSA